MKYGVKEEVGDRSEANEARNLVCAECRWVKIWVMGVVDGGRRGEVLWGWELKVVKLLGEWRR